MKQKTTFKDSEVFDMTEKEYTKIWKEFEIRRINSDNLLELAEDLNLCDAGKLGVFAFLFGRCTLKNNAANELSEFMGGFRK